MKKPAFCICEKTGADQLRGNRPADQCLCFRYIDSTIRQLHKSQNFKPLAVIGGCTAVFVSDLVRNPEDSFFSQHDSFLERTDKNLIPIISVVSVCIHGP